MKNKSNKSGKSQFEEIFWWINCRIWSWYYAIWLRKRKENAIWVFVALLSLWSVAFDGKIDRRRRRLPHLKLEIIIIVFACRMRMTCSFNIFLFTFYSILLRTSSFSHSLPIFFLFHFNKQRSFVDDTSRLRLCDIFISFIKQSFAFVRGVIMGEC